MATVSVRRASFNAVKRPDFVIRHMNVIDNDRVLEICNTAGLAIGNHTNITMMKVDSKCLYVAEDTLTGKVIGLCSGLNLSDDFSFVGPYIVEPKYQEFGIGIALFNRCVEHCGKRNHGLFSDAKMISLYREMGFRVIPGRHMMSYNGFPQLFSLNKYLNECDMEWITVRNLTDIIDYDEQVCGINRAKFLELTIAEPGTVSMLARYIENGYIAGYAIFKITNMNAIQPQPLYADTEEIAEALAYNCISKFVAFDKMCLDAWDTNKGANVLAAKLGLSLKKKSAIMFTQKDLTANFKRIYYISPSNFYPF